MKSNSDDANEQPDQRLVRLVNIALDVVKKARKHHCSLTGANYYAGKLAELRSDAVNAFRELDTGSIGGATSLAELIEPTFSPATERKHRTTIARELLHQLRTRQPTKRPPPTDESGLFPLSLLAQTKRGYIITIGKEMNGTYGSGWYDASAVMMRRLLETTIIEAFEHHKIDHKIKNHDGNFLALTDLITIALKESNWNLSRNARAALPKLKNVGHISAHSRRFTAQKADMDKLQPDARIAIEEFLHLAALI
jgi:hypothetical protein